MKNKTTAFGIDILSLMLTTMGCTPKNGKKNDSKTKYPIVDVGQSICRTLGLLW